MQADSKHALCSQLQADVLLPTTTQEHLDQSMSGQLGHDDMRARNTYHAQL